MNNLDTSDFPFLDRLGRHLQQAAIERVTVSQRQRRRQRSAVVAMSLTGVLALVAATVVILWPHAEPARAFTIARADGIVRVEVSNLVTDPEAATAQLQDAGVNATLRAVPVPDELVAHVVSLSVFGGIEVEVTRGNTGVTAFEVDGTGSFVIQYGRPAAEGETYEATQSSLYCAAWRDRRVGDLRSEIESSIETIRWQMFNTSNYRLTEVPQPDANAFVQDVIPLSTQESIIIVSDQQDSLPTTGEC